jgi:uncharacterized protein with FMN-binding domain
MKGIAMLRAVLAIIGTAAGLVFLLSFKTHGTSAAITPPAAVSSPSGTPAAPSAARTPSSTSTAPAATRTVTGTAAGTRYGPVQVKITVKNGKLVEVDAVVYPQGDPRDAQINAYAIPELDKEALAAGSAQIDTVSGATYTSEGYVASLQSALDKAGG